MAPVCSEKLDVIERMTARSSAQLRDMGEEIGDGEAASGRSWLNFQGEPRVLPLLLNWVGSIFILKGWPCSLVRRGLGSKESIGGDAAVHVEEDDVADAGGKWGSRRARGLEDEDGG